MTDIIGDASWPELPVPDTIIDIGLGTTARRGRQCKRAPGKLEFTDLNVEPEPHQDIIWPTSARYYLRPSQSRLDALTDYQRRSRHPHFCIQGAIPLS